MTWTRVAPGHYTRGPWVIRRQAVRHAPDRPWSLWRAPTRDIEDNPGSPVGSVSRHHTLVLAKRSADQWDAAQPAG